MKKHNDTMYCNVIHLYFNHPQRTICMRSTWTHHINYRKGQNGKCVLQILQFKHFTHFAWWVLNHYKLWNCGFVISTTATLFRVGLPACPFKPLQMIKSAAARWVFEQPKTARHSTVNYSSLVSCGREGRVVSHHGCVFHHSTAPSNSTRSML